MFEGDGAFPRQPVHGGKDLAPGIVWHQGGEFIQRAGAGPCELLLDGRFDHNACAISSSLPDKKRMMTSVLLSRTTVWLF